MKSCHFCPLTFSIIRARPLKAGLEYSYFEPGSNSGFSACITGALENYFRNLDGEQPSAIYDMVIKSVERPMIEVTLLQAGGNQTLAAEMLGINRNTLRKKITEYRLL